MDWRKFKLVDGSNFEKPKIQPRAVVILVTVLITLLLVRSILYTVDTEEVGVVLTFGKYTKTVDPGLRVKWPFPFQTVTKVPVQRQLKQEFGFATISAGIRSNFSQPSQGESLMLTGDLNVAVVEWTTQYRVNNPYLYLFKVRNLFATFRDMNEAVMRAVVGDRSVTEVLTVGRQEIASEVERRMQEFCDQYETGIKIEQIVLKNVNPPDEVKPSFNEVNQAQQERETLINEALANFNKIIPRARGEALQAIQMAEGYATSRINHAKGDADRFDALLAAYQKAPAVTRNRIYLETMEQVLPKVGRKIVLDADLKSILPLMSLDAETKK